MTKLEFYIVDVFAEKKYSGNQLAVFLDAQDLNESSMLQIAKEINFAESAFILRGNEEHGFDIKIFTPESEVPFAGHPTVGTAFVIRNLILRKELNELWLNLKVGKIKTTFLPSNEEVFRTFVTQVQPEFNNYFDRKEIASLLNLENEDIVENLPVCEISTGLPFIIVPVNSMDAIKRIKTDASSFLAFVKSKSLYKLNNPTGLTTSIFCFTPETYENHNDFNTRMLCIEDEILKEDAATGSANGCFLAYYLKFINPKANLSIEQGYEIGRPSRLYLRGALSDDHFEINVGGSTLLVAHGEWIV